MQNIVTLIANVKEQKLDENILNKVFVALEKKSASITDVKWLALDEACDVFFDGIITAEKAREATFEVVGDKKIDFIVQKTKTRRKKLLISDMDSTIINQECIDEIAQKLGIKDKVAEITEKTMNGELDFDLSLKERVSLLSGVHEDDLMDVYENNISLTPGAKNLVATMSANDAYCILVSGGFTFFTEKISKELGFNEHRANRLVFNGKSLNGRVVEPILNQDSKLLALEEMLRIRNISKDDVLAVGDGANDLPMLTAVDAGIAYHAKEKVREQVDHKIGYTDLTSLLYMQGYEKKEFVG